MPILKFLEYVFENFYIGGIYKLNPNKNLSGNKIVLPMRVDIIGEKHASISQKCKFDSHCRYYDLIDRRSYKSLISAL